MKFALAFNLSILFIYSLIITFLYLDMQKVNDELKQNQAMSCAMSKLLCK